MFLSHKLTGAAAALMMIATPAWAMGKKHQKSGAHFAREFRYDRFYKGNTHTHSLRSDGDSSPEKVIAWYRDHGYQFLVLTDHNFQSAWGEFASLEQPGRFVVVPGEEVTFAHDRPAGETDGRPVRAVHLSQLCGTETIPGQKINPAEKALQTAVDLIGAQTGAVAIVNHPNYEWGLPLASLRAVPNFHLMEIANQHFDVHNAGDATHPSTEVLWDSLLTDGRTIYGVASDDEHDLIRTQTELGFPPRPPGKGWLQVAADVAGSLEPKAICSAIDRGAFYFSTGAEFASVEAKSDRMSLVLSAGMPAAKFEFFGAGGRPLQTAQGTSSDYVLKGGEGYVRARVTLPDGHQAWTQAARVNE
ncbi:MAG TPA: CehA/McbA family metallohydrolase [Bdellovibrionota bacterium]|nr:CehA/McbA family metallohydrolase [Bdellovibrionota bacterium]